MKINRRLKFFNLRMKDILSSREVPLRLGPKTLEEAKAEIETLERWLNEHTD